MKKFLLMLQFFLKMGLVFVLVFIWCKFFLNDLYLSILISITVSFITTMIITLITKKSLKETSLKIKEKEEAEDMFLSLSSQTNSFQIDFFYNLIKTRHQVVYKKSRYVLLSQTHSNYSKTILYPFLKFQKFQVDDLLTLIKLSKKDNPNKIVIVCNEYEKSLSTFIKNQNIEIVLLDKYEVYKNLYQEYEFYPKIITKSKKEIKKTMRDFLSFAFNKSRTKSYIISSLLLFLSSFWIGMNLYYNIVSSILLIFALISYLNPKYNTKSYNELL